MPLSVETVEYNLAKQLLIIRNPILAQPDEAVILGRNGWVELSEDETLAAVPPSPNASRRRKRTLSESNEAGDTKARDTDAAPAVKGTPKRSLNLATS
ncbi:MAG: hypothetical protein CYPHOPRED_005627 [Cyphobasidiales sp. Tagirdzhanova-0007]|nr:MAG: hypothetical protein CYPHOPRED_005627 [Cyphobasidiales sp. Tagirdzhanova-0007]